MLILYTVRLIYFLLLPCLAFIIVMLGIPPELTGYFELKNVSAAKEKDK